MSVYRAALALARMLAVAGCFAACGDNLDAGNPRSGMRLRLVTYVYEDGTREVDRVLLHDIDLDERCTPRVFSDGARYCAPERAGGETVFVDERCTLPVGVVDDGDERPELIVRYFSLRGEKLPSRIYRTGSPIDAPARIWEHRDGECLGPLPPRPGAFFDLGEELGTDRLARVVETERVAGARMHLGIDASADGLRTPGMLYDAVLDRACVLAPSANAERATCVPDDVPRTGYYRDAACMEPVLALPIGMSAELAVHQSPRTACWELREVGDALAASSNVFVQLDGRCIATSMPSGSVLHATMSGGEVASAARMVETTTSSRLAPITLVDGLLEFRDGAFFDAELGSECARDPVRAHAGEHVCLPFANMEAQTVFADAQCTTALRLAFVPSDGCHLPSHFATDGVERYRVGDPYASTFFELEPGDRCGTLAAPSGFIAHVLGDALPASAFATATIEIDD